jgi:hypothetical protein
MLARELGPERIWPMAANPSNIINYYQHLVTFYKDDIFLFHEFSHTTR